MSFRTLDSGQIHESIENKRLIKEQIRHKLVLSEDEAKQSKKSTMKWWSKFVCMMIAKTVSRNVTFKAGKMSGAIFETQADFVTPEVGGQVFPSEHKSLERNADLYFFLCEVVQN